MSRRIDVELTSDRGDGTWSWRAAGARQPKGVLDAALLYEGARVGDVVRAEADFDIEGIEVTSVQAPKGARQEPETIEVRGAEKEFTPITSSLTGKARERAERGEDDRPRRGRDDRGPRPGGAGGPGQRPGGRPGGPPRGEGERGPRPGDRQDRPQRPPRPAPPAPKPKAKKLRPQRVHRDALLASLSPEQQPIAEQLLRGGMPAVRAAVEEQNAKAKAEDGLEVPVDTVLGIAEQLVTRARVADWLDRAEAAKETGEELALRDLRSVVSTADDVARDETTRELAAELKAMLEQRTEAEQRGWLTDIEDSLTGGRVVRALRLSSRPPEPGNTFPTELTSRLTEAANDALTAEIASDRWATVLDAVAYSPVRRAVVPAGVPSEPTEELLVAVRKHAGRTPAIATLFGVDAPADKAKGPKRPTKAAGRNPNLSRAGGPRGATVPVPGRPGGPPVPPIKRIPPPPGRQIGATLPGSPPIPSPAPAPGPPADPTAPLTPPSATGATEPAASLGTPAATPADLQPTTPSAGAPGGGPPAATHPADGPGAGTTAPASEDLAVTTPPEAAEGPASTDVPVATPAEAPSSVPTAPDAGTAVPAAAAPAAGATAPDVEPPAPASPGTAEAAAADAAPTPATSPETESSAPQIGAPPDAEVTVPTAAEAELALDAALTLTDGPGPEATAVIAAAAFDSPPATDQTPSQTAGAPTEAPEPPAATGDDTTGDHGEHAAAAAGAPAEAAPVAAAFDAPAVLTDPSVAPAAESAAAHDQDVTSEPVETRTDPLVVQASEAGAEVLASAPSDSSLPDPAPTAEPSGTGEGSAQGGDERDAVAEQVARLDAVVSQAAAGPFEPPADPPVEDAPNSGVGTLAAEQEGGVPPEEPSTA